jgi:hypothetical protein
MTAGAGAASALKKHKVRLEHKVRGRIRMKVPSAKSNPDLLEVYREAFSAIPGIDSVKVKPESGSIIIHYDPRREREFERQFDSYAKQHLTMTAAPEPDDEVGRVAKKIEAGAKFLAQRSSVANAIFECCTALDHDLKVLTGNTIDLKIVVAGGLAAYTFLELGVEAGTPMWVTLAIFSLNHFAKMHGEPPPAPVLS